MNRSTITTTTSRKNLIRTTREVVLLSLLCLGLSIVGNLILPIGIPWRGEWQTGVAIPNPGGRCKPQTETGHFDAVLKEYESWDTVFVDARSHEHYVEGHIPRAISLPIGEAESKITEFMTRYPQDLKLVVYCTGFDCYDSHDLAAILRRYGYHNLYVYSGGYDDWVGHQREVTKGEQP